MFYVLLYIFHSAMCASVAKTHDGCLPADRSDTSDEDYDSSSDSSDVIILDHKPADWIDRTQVTSRKRRREDDDDDDDDVIALDNKPADWIDRPRDSKKRRHEDLSQDN
jgi:hypothetical protein